MTNLVLSRYCSSDPNKDSTLGYCFSNIGFGILALVFFVLNLYSLLKVTNKFKSKKYYIPIFVLSLLQNILVLLHSLVISTYFILKIIQITMIIYTFIMVAKFKILEDTLGQREVDRRMLAIFTLLFLGLIGFMIYNVVQSRCGKHSIFYFTWDLLFNLLGVLLLIYYTYKIIKAKKNGSDGSEKGFLRSLVKRVS